MRPDEEEAEEPEFESGPYCWHWGEPGDCDHPCLRESCKHPCKDHGAECRVEGCGCPGIMYESHGEIVEAKP